MDIVIVAQYLLDITKAESANSRFVYIANMLKQKHSVEIVTSDFIHSRKENVCPVTEYQGIPVTMLHESGYKKNISLRRFVSHAELARRIYKYLDRRKKPDVVYCAIPSTAVAFSVAKYCKRNDIKFVVDIQDLWPEAFKMVFDIPLVSDVLYFPINYKANNVYKTADAIVSVSNTYLKRAKQVSKTENTEVVFLGTDKSQFDVNQREKHNDDIIKLVYVGSLERSYDLETVIKAVAKFSNVQLVVLGDGSCRSDFERIAEESKANCVFVGRVPYSEMISRMSECDIAVNPIRKGSAGSIINKVGDYAMAGLPVINTQECEEYRELLEVYQCGINCECGNVDDVARAIEVLSEDEALRREMGINSRRLGEDRFDRAMTYLRILDLIENTLTEK